MTVQYIDTDEALVTFCPTIKHAKWITVDTEFLRERTYSPQLCLIQVATEDIIACIDPLTIQNLDPILDILYDSTITKVFHAARQDLELLYLLRDNLPSNVFDTQIAATVLGYGEQIGYGNLVKQCLNIDLDKAHSRTDWTKRPLDPAQVNYAADDVRYLRDVYQLLKQQLEEKNRTHWLDDDFAQLTSINTYKIDVDTLWRKVKGFGRLKGIQLAILQRLAAWREQRAIKVDRPRRWILKDDVLLDLAKLAPDSIDTFSLIRGLEANTIHRHGNALLTEIKHVKSLAKNEWPVVKKTKPLTQQQNAIVDVLMALLRKYCDQQTISPTAVASRKEIERLFRGETDLPIYQGWRNEIVGHYLHAFIDGKLSITADPNQLNIQ